MYGCECKKTIDGLSQVARCVRLCDMGKDETVVEHVLLECDKYDCERRVGR